MERTHSWPQRSINHEINAEREERERGTLASATNKQMEVKLERTTVPYC